MKIGFVQSQFKNQVKQPSLLLFMMIFFSASFQWFVATCSQDNYIRIWQLSFDENNNNQTNVDSAALKLKRNSFALKISGRLSCKSIYLSRLFPFFN